LAGTPLTAYENKNVMLTGIVAAVVVIFAILATILIIMNKTNVCLYKTK